jgi:hypothetical protein
MRDLRDILKLGGLLGVLLSSSAAWAAGAADSAGETAEDATELSAPTTPPPAAEVRSYLGSFALDPAGFLLFGPTASLEFGIGHVAGAATFRWFDPGLLSQALFVKSGQNFAPSVGGGIRGRYYFDVGFQGVHVGLAVELLQTNIENPSSMTVARSLYLVPQVEGGYRWAFGRFFLGPSASFGYAAQLSGQIENMPGGTSAGLYTVENRSSVYGAAKLDIGVLF